MAFGVRKFPDSNDPRPANFCWRGWEFGALPAYRYILSTTGASGSFVLLNDGVLVLYGSEIDPVNYWLRSDSPSLPFTSALEISGYETLQTVPVDHTIRWHLVFSAGGQPTHDGSSYAVRPNAITGWPTVAVAPIGPGSNSIPNPVTITPAIYDHPLIP